MLDSIATQFNSGGPFMWIILGLFAVACAVVVERLVYYFITCRGKGHALVSDISNALEEDDVEKARTVAGSKSTPLHNLLKAAVDKYGSGATPEKIQEGIEEAAILELPKTTQRLNYLSLLANIATLLGLLGTIAGLQVSFSSLASVDAAQKASMLASGISQAMNTTACGLIVAVPCMVMFTALSNKQQSLVKEIDASVVKLANYMKAKLA